MKKTPLKTVKNNIADITEKIAILDAVKIDLEQKLKKERKELVDHYRNSDELSLGSLEKIKNVRKDLNG